MMQANLLRSGMRTTISSKMQMHLVQRIAHETVGDTQVANQHLGLLHRHLFGRALHMRRLSEHHKGACHE